MNIEITTNTDATNSTLVIIPSTMLANIDKDTQHMVTAELKINDTVTTPLREAGKNKNLLVYNLHESLENIQIKRFFGNIGKRLLKHVEVELSFPDTLTGEALEAAITGLLQGSYSFDAYRKEKRSTLKKINIKSFNSNNQERLRQGCIVGESINACRDMINTPANHMGPEEFTNYARAAADMYGLKLENMSIEDCERMGMGGIVNVGRSSHRPARLLIISWPGIPTNQKECTPIALCGKGVCFDTGGLNLKNIDGMALMRKDMGGAACVLSAIIAIARLKLPHPVTAFIPLADNAISSASLRPGDIISMHNGTTVEISNTDNEGRLLLADAISFAASSVNLKAIISVATLTGEALSALGRVYVPVMSNEKTWLNNLMHASTLAGEKLWQLPLDNDYLWNIQGNSADLSNVCKGEAGCISAGLFLSKFSKELPFVHCDISPSSWMTRDHELGPDGATGVLVGSLVKLVESVSE